MNSLLSFTSVLRRIVPGVPTARSHNDLLVNAIGNAAARLAHDRDAALADRTAALRQRVGRGTPITHDDVMVPAFALVFESARRALGITLYDVQLLGGLAMSRQTIAEMQTGEGKTFAAMLPAVLHALTGRGVHVMTTNRYLAQRDFEQLAPVYRMLGITVGLIRPEASLVEKQDAYRCDITYGPGYEFGFDYLRDQAALIAQRSPQLGESFRRRLQGREAGSVPFRQRCHAAAIVDEADSVMLDEATTPLILAAGGGEPAANADVYRAAAEAAERFIEQQEFVTDEKTGTTRLTEQAHRRLASQADAPQRGHLDRPWATYVEQAVHAAVGLQRDVHYVVRDDCVQLVDQCTGRIFDNRSWRDGLHQAVQTKEHVPVTSETRTLARITRQRYFGVYRHLCGMTGTAEAGRRELRDVYGVDVTPIPLNRPCLRETLPTRCFADLATKEQVIVDQVARISATQRPVLVGTVSIDKSERLARRLDGQHIGYQLLNGKQDEQEATIVARAGRRGAVTIATNMAGRGTDIRLGPGVADLGGLHVVAAEPHESTRVDRQLVGRAARQGDSGSCQLFASADDRLFARHAPNLVQRMRQLADDSGEIHADLTRQIVAAQRTAERSQAALRRQAFLHDDWLETVLRELAAL